MKEGVIDANKCLAWLLQKPGIFDREYRVALHDRIYGCDDCQTACPQVRRKELNESTEQLQSVVEVLSWLSMDDETLNASCARWYVHKRDMAWIRRNLLIVLGNIASPDDPEVVNAIRTYLSHSRSELRAHAVWAAARLGLTELINHEDSDPMVCDELLHLPTLREGL